MSVNKVILVGNVGKDPETRYLDENTAMAKFPLATSETYRNRNGERITNTEWHNIVLWRGLAQVAEKYVKKGTQLFIEGRIRTRSYDDPEGNRRYITEIVGDQMQMLGRRSDDSDQSSPYAAGTQAQAGGGIPDSTAAAQQGTQSSPVSQTPPQAGQAGTDQFRAEQPGQPAGNQNTGIQSPGPASAPDQHTEAEKPFPGREDETDDLPF
ncbi:MAG: single-stranded DNA-binding protein [Bacteroidetes bacterium]|nr:MAG: single-stranded DNA-binding protein [Bacteroidota bacterium]